MGVYGVEGDVFEQPLETFSQGQLKKIDLVRSMMQPSNLLIWDEPMNYIDVMSREQIEEAIIVNQPTMLFTDHDRYFVEKVATSVIDLDSSR
jgi:lincosamide and streptogramin A transport system ATP-binding/permease protein